MLDGYSGNWSALACRGAVAILLGIIVILLPGPTIAAIVILFGVYAMMDGVFAVIAAVRGVRRHDRWGAMLVRGAAGIVVGSVAFFWPVIGALGLAYLVAAWAFVTGVFEIAAAMQLRRTMAGEWLLLVAGIVSIVFGVLVAIFPGVGVVLLVWWLGAYAIVYGAVTLALSLRVRHWLKTSAVAP